MRDKKSADKILKYFFLISIFSYKKSFGLLWKLSPTDWLTRYFNTRNNYFKQQTFKFYYRTTKFHIRQSLEHCFKTLRVNSDIT